MPKVCQYRMFSRYVPKFSTLSARMVHPRRSPNGSAGGPKGYGDEQDLHRDSEPQACGRLAAKSYASACGVNIGRQDGQEKSDQRIGGDTAEFGEEKPDRPAISQMPVK